jgi:hypothetical protein
MNSALSNSIDELLAPYGARRLSSHELAKHPSKHKSSGWEVIFEELQWNGENLVVWLLFDEREDKRIPTVYVVSPEIKPLEIPHIENYGKLCVWPSRYIIDLNDISYVEELLRNAFELLNEAINGELASHFKDEFTSYWGLEHDYNNKFISILDLSNTKSRQIVVKNIGGMSYVFGESSDDVEKWLRNRNRAPGEKEKRKYKKFHSLFESSVLICFDRFIAPDEYPKSIENLIELVEQECAEESPHIIDLILKSLSMAAIANPTMLLLFYTEGSKALVSLTSQKKKSTWFSEYNQSTSADGFRAKSKIPVDTFQSLVSKFPLKRGRVLRSDISWVIGRDSNEDRENLSDVTVAIVGCGSLGSSVAKLLVKSGIDQLILIDPEILYPENTSRHELGYDYVSDYKVEGLKNRLCKEFPHITVDVSHNPVELSGDVRKKLGYADVVVSCTADWHADQYLLAIQNEEFFQLVFAFVESHAMAGHVVLNTPETNAYTSLFYGSGSNIGKLRVPVTLWNEETMLQIPACAGEFQPYGAIEIAHLHALVAKVVVKAILVDDELRRPSHTIWLGSSEDLYALNGVWNDEWERVYGAANNGNKMVAMEYVDNIWIHKNGIQV